MFEGRAQGLCEPVGVHAVFGLLLEEHQQVAPFGVLAADGPVCRRENLHLLVVLHEFFRVHQVVRRQVGRFDAGIERVRNLDAALLGHLRCDHDHAVRCARTVDRRCRGVLEDRDALHAVDVEVINLLDIYLEPVEDENRQRGVGLERIFRDIGHTVRTADFDAVGNVVGVRTEFSVEVRNHERRVVNLQRFEHVGRIDLDQVVALHLRCRTREAVFGFGNVARDHQCFGFDNVCLHRDFQRLVADVERL